MCMVDLTKLLRNVSDTASISMQCQRVSGSMVKAPDTNTAQKHTRRDPIRILAPPCARDAFWSITQLLCVHHRVYPIRNTVICHILFRCRVLCY